MNILLLDIGNSRLKWALAEDGVLQSITALVHSAQAFESTLFAQWQEIALPPTRLVVSCVSHAVLLGRVITLAQQLWPTIQVSTPKAQASALGVQSVYLQPESLGVDRWLALLAVRQRTQQAACVVDCGTAITLDLMNDDGQHLGGVISPGLHLMKHSLAAGTEQLTWVAQTFTPGLAAHTHGAIYSGTLFAAVGLIEKIIRSQEIPVQVFLTGGDASVIAAELAVANEVLDDLVLQGLLCLSLSGSLPE